MLVVSTITYTDKTSKKTDPYLESKLLNKIQTLFWSQKVAFTLQDQSQGCLNVRKFVILLDPLYS